MKSLTFVVSICIAMFMVASVWADPDLVIYYSFDSFSNVVPDDSGKGHDGAVVGDVTPNAGGFRGGAAQFANAGYLDLDGPNFTASDIPVNAMTLCAWAKVVNTGDHHALFNARATDETWVVHPELRSDGVFRWLLRTDGGTTIFDIKGGQWTAGEWIHFAGVYDKVNGTLYINGAKVGELAGTATIVGDWGLGARVGKNIDDARPFTGLMDDFCIFKRALSVDEVAALMTDGPPVETAVQYDGSLSTTWGGIKAVN